MDNANTNPTPPSPPSQPIINQAPPVNVQVEKPKPKRTVLKIIGVIVLVIVLLGILGYISLKKQNNTISKPFSGSMQITPDKKRDFNPVWYSKPNVMPATNVFTDEYLNITFQYPQTYKIYSLEAVSKDPRVLAYFLKSSDPGEKGSMINCYRENRIVDSGLCSESVGSGVEVWVHRFTPGEDNSLFFYEKDKYCDKSVEDNKTIFSCISSNLDGSATYRYAVYIKSGNEWIQLTIDTRDALGYREIINSVISTFSLKNK